MGAIDKQKRGMQRKLKSQRKDLDKAKKLAYTLFHHLLEAEGKASDIDRIVNELPSTELDDTFKLIQSKKRISHSADLKRLLRRVITAPARMCMARVSSRTPLVPSRSQRNVKIRRVSQPSVFSLRERLEAKKKAPSPARRALAKPISAGCLKRAKGGKLESSIGSRYKPRSHVSWSAESYNWEADSEDGDEDED